MQLERSVDMPGIFFVCSHRSYPSYLLVVSPCHPWSKTGEPYVIARICLAAILHRSFVIAGLDGSVRIVVYTSCDGDR